MFSNGSSCLSPAPSLLSPIQNPSAPKHRQLPQLPVVLVGLCQPRWGGFHLPPTKGRVAGDPAFTAPLPKEK